MLYLIVGKNYSLVKKEADGIASLFLKKNSGQVEYHTAETILPNDLLYRSGGNSLFGGKFAYVIDGLIDQYKDEVLNILKELSESEHLFVFCEDSVSKEVEKAFSSFNSKNLILKTEEKERDNPFAITDALINKDRKRMWQLYRKEIEKGESPEAIVGRLAWAMKTLVLIMKNPKESATNLGISPFVYTKTKSSMTKWDTASACVFYSELLFGLPNSGETEYHLEKLILTI